MVITRNWISKFVNISNINKNDIFNVLNSLGYEVEKYKELINLNTNIVLGKIIFLEKMADSDHLNITKVKIGKSKIIDIICGANNLENDMYVIVALPGAKLANGLEIKSTKIRKYKSEGMICSFSELGYKDESFSIKSKSIIKVVSKFAKDDNLGSKDILKQIGLEDAIFDYDITWNRSYGLSGYEVIKELGNNFNQKVKELMFINNSIIKNNTVINLECESIVKALSSIKLTIKNSVFEMPFSNLIKHLNSKKDGVNAIRDYIGLEQGQPILIIDADKIKKNLILSNNFIDKNHNIAKGDLVLISDNEYVSLIGIKNNQKYMVSSGTKNIIAIALNLDETFIRSQQKKFSVNSIDIQGYMRFTSPININNSLLRFITILNLQKYLLSYSEIKYHKKTTKKINKIVIDSEYVSKLIGKNLSTQMIKSLLEKSFFNLKAIGKNKLEVIIPEIRSNLITNDDLIEEILRLYGYDNIEAEAPNIEMVSKKYNKIENIKNTIKGCLLNNGFYEAKTYSLVHQQENTEYNFFNYRNEYKLEQSLSTEHEVMRFSLLNSLLKMVEYNNSRQIKQVKGFTMENIYFDNKSVYHLGIISKGNNNHKISNSVINSSYFYLKGLLESIINKLGIAISEFSFKENNSKYFNQYQSSTIYFQKKIFGVLGEIHPDITNKLNIKEPVYGLEINLSVLLENKRKSIQYNNSAVFNNITRDISILLKDEKYEDVKNKLIKGVKFIKKIDVIDYYKGKDIPDNMHSVTFSFIFNDEKNQLTDLLVNEEYNKLLDNITKLNLKINN